MTTTDQPDDHAKGRTDAWKDWATGTTPDPETVELRGLTAPVDYLAGYGHEADRLDRQYHGRPHPFLPGGEQP